MEKLTVEKVVFESWMQIFVSKELSYWSAQVVGISESEKSLFAVVIVYALMYLPR